VSWAAHELESYFLQKHVKVKVSYAAVLLGCLLPDLFTKLPVYGVNIGSMTFIKAHFPAKYHRGWPGVGFTHSFFFVFLFALVLLAVTRNRGWFVGLCIGGAAHVLTDMFDTVGTMAFFPFTTLHYTVGMWAYASQEGRYGDAAAYYSSLGGVWDFMWLCLAVAGYQVFSRQYYATTVEPNDPMWGGLERRFQLSERTKVVLYRAFFIYGACRIFAWFGWARLLNPRRGVETLDWSWGGPGWVDKAPRFERTTSWTEWLTLTTKGAVLFALAVTLVWQLVGRRLWVRAR
jgi:membrane-bound metal-dependent hydrolase YbcI (DUF457 family)